MEFVTSELIDEWVEKHSEICNRHTAGGEQFIYKFLPNGIVECQTVECMHCKEKFVDYVG